MDAMEFLFNLFTETIRQRVFHLYASQVRQLLCQFAARVTIYEQHNFHVNANSLRCFDS